MIASITGRRALDLDQWVLARKYAAPYLEPYESGRAFLAAILACVGCGDETSAQSVPRTPPSESRSGTGNGDQHLRAEADLVLVPVTVTDQKNHLVMGLEKNNFSIFDQNETQVICHLSSEDAPISLGIIFDTSSSMYGKMDRSREAVVQFLRSSNPADEFFLVGFNEPPALLVDFTSSVKEIQSKISDTKPDGTTALLDAFILAWIE